MKRSVMVGALRQRAPASILAGIAMWLGASVVRAEVIDLQWPDGSRFERSLTIAPGKFAEICGSLDTGQTVNWAFEADRALNFNVHFHVDKDVRYPARMDQVKRLKGDLGVDAKRDYCWMWSNKTTTEAKLSVTLMRKSSSLDGWLRRLTLQKYATARSRSLQCLIFSPCPPFTLTADNCAAPPG